MTKFRFYVLAAIVGFFAHDGRGQTLISASQIACPASSLPVAAIALPPVVGGSRQSRIVCVTLDPAVFRYDAGSNTLRVVGSQIVENEAPAGTIDGGNAAFTLASAPSPASSLRLYRNGIRLTAGTDYSLAGNTITFMVGALPGPGDALLADYRH